MFLTPEQLALVSGVVASVFADEPVSIQPGAPPTGDADGFLERKAA